MDLLLIGGVSGSGKSVVLAALEDSGYHAINNLATPMLVETVAHLARSGQERVAVALDVKTGPGLRDLAGAIAAAKRAGWTVRFLYLDAKTDTLVKRFSETRRRHPFSSDERTLTEAIDHERALLAETRELGFAFDTSDLSAPALRGWIKDFIAVDPTKLTLLFESFGFKHGVPLDADLVFDVRCLPNPHYEPLLAPLDGRDAPVVTFLESLPEVERMYGRHLSFRGELAARLCARQSQLPDRGHRLHRRPASLGLSGRAVGQDVRRALSGPGPAP